MRSPKKSDQDRKKTGRKRSVSAKRQQGADVPLKHADGATLQRAISHSIKPSAADIRALQRAVGHRAVRRLIQAKPGGGMAPDQYEQRANRGTQRQYTIQRDIGSWFRGLWNRFKYGRAPAPFTTANIQFASVMDSKVCSIYFRGGRIRLTHSDGPKVSVHPGVLRFAMPEATYLSWQEFKQGGQRAFEEYQEFMTARRVRRAAPGVPGRVVEIWGGGTKTHASRGEPQEFTLPQDKLNIVYRIASKRLGNKALQEAMAKDDVLKEIPIKKF